MKPGRMWQDARGSATDEQDAGKDSSPARSEPSQNGKTSTPQKTLMSQQELPIHALGVWIEMRRLTGMWTR